MINLPKKLSDKNNNICLLLLSKNNSKWIAENTDIKLMRNVFPNQDNEENLEKYYNSIFSWSYVYLICDIKNTSYGLIRIVPELDNQFSIHGIGWPNDNLFSRVYFNAWKAIHIFLFKKLKRIISSCSQVNFKGMNVLIKSGYQPTFINNLFKNDRRINFALTEKNFKNSIIYNSFDRNELNESNFKFNFNKKIKWHSFKKSNFKSNLSIKIVDQAVIKTSAIKNRLRIDLPKKITQIRFLNILINILYIKFPYFSQIHLEILNDVSFVNLMKLKLNMHKILECNKLDLIHIYYNNRNKKNLKFLINGDFIINGDDKFRRCLLLSK